MQKLFKINAKTRDFVKYYRGDVIDALKAAGYSGSDSYLKSLGRSLLKQPEVISMIQEHAKYVQSKFRNIAQKEEIQSFLTNTMRNEDTEWKKEIDALGMVKEQTNISMPNRLKAAELLGKTQAIFIDRLDVEGKITLTDIVRKSYAVDDENLDDIEAEYLHAREVKMIQATGVNPDPFGEMEAEAEAFEMEDLI